MESVKLRVTSLILAIIAAISSLILMMEKIELWKNPDYVPSCTWNILFSCQGPMESWQASTFVIPNPILGMVGYTIMIMVLVLSFTTELPKWVWGAYLAGAGVSLAYLTWLQYATVFDIKALCIYCMVVWACAIPIFWLGTKGYIDAYSYNGKVTSFISRLTPALIITHFGIIILVIYLQFQDFWLFLIGVR